MWQLDNALTVVRALQPTTRDYGYHLTLGGGVLNKGESNKDLDLYFLPMGGFNGVPTNDPDGMLKHLSKLWGESHPLATVYGNSKGFYKHAVQFIRWGGINRETRQRIDCFIF